VCMWRELNTLSPRTHAGRGTPPAASDVLVLAQVYLFSRLFDSCSAAIRAFSRVCGNLVLAKKENIRPSFRNVCRCFAVLATPKSWKSPT
jgi:hypothetical protein